MRENLLQCLYQVSDPKIVGQYKRSLKVIVRADFPDRWQSLVDQCLHYAAQS